MNESLESQVLERTRLLIDANREMDIFLYRASHDLRSPICSIIGLCNIVMHSNSTESLDLVRRVSDTAFKMDRMLKKLRIISEINQPAQFSSIELSYMVDAITGQFAKFIGEHEVEVNNDCDEELKFYSNRGLLDVILYNLIDNALFFSSIKANHQARVDIGAEIISEHVIISVRDNGIGIDENIRMKLWDMFFVGHEFSKGNGLGLYLVFKSVQALQGRIELDTEPGRFTMFKVIIPLVRNDKSLFSYNRPGLTLMEANDKLIH